jgi:23S rRNA-/tRNA-specific pseudouridylate synthase
VIGAVGGLRVTKTYWALVRGAHMAHMPQEGLLQSRLVLRDDAAASGEAVPGALLPARLAQTRWRMIARHPEGWAWLSLQPITGTPLLTSFPLAL